MIVQDAIDLALARCAELGAKVSGPKSLMIQRISQYQQRLYAMASDWNDDYFGTCVVGTLALGKLDLSDIVSPIETIERITLVEIANPGTSTWLAKDEVSIVELSDRLDADIPPRATIRRKVLEGVSTDLDLVTSLRVHYSPVPLAISVSTGQATVLSIPAPHDGLVPLDLTLYLLDRLPAPDASVAAGRASVVAEQAMALAAFQQHITDYVGTLRSRFGSEPFASGEPT